MRITDKCDNCKYFFEADDELMCTENECVLEDEEEEVMIMRDPNRIDKFCDELKTIWHKVPDLRFGQFMESTMDAWNTDPINKCSLFYVEDEEFFNFMNEYWNENQK